jgi:tetratricopeptide (TPR) repeat protein
MGLVQVATECFYQALLRDPSMWCAFEKLASYNPRISIEQVFTVEERQERENVKKGAKRVD